MEKYSVGILLFDDVELLDFAGPYEVFSVAAHLAGLKILDVFTVSESKSPIKTYNGLKCLPDYDFSDVPPVSILIIPGGEGSKKVIENPNYTNWTQKVNDTSLVTASVCSGARILAFLKLLDNFRATTHAEVFEELQKSAPHTTWLPEERFVDNGKIMTAGGVSAGIDLSLHIVQKLFGARLADKVIEYMEYKQPV